MSPIKVHPYKHPKRFKHDIERKIKEILDLGFIRLSSSPFASSLMLVKIKDGTMCMCIDYRDLNKNTIKNIYPISRIDGLVDEIYGDKYFSKIDLCSGYHQIQMRGRISKIQHSCVIMGTSTFWSCILD